VPDGVILLTASVDVQDDRLECLVKGWGLDDESWFIDLKVFYGSPAQGEVWNMLDIFLKGKWKHELGVTLGIICVCIDSGGHFTQNVYEFTKARAGRRYFAVKGFGGYGKPFIGKVSRNNRLRAPMIPLGVDTGKELIYARLEIDDPGPGYMHFSEKCDEEYFNQLTAERHITKYSRGFPTKVWVKKEGQRNEALDLEVYALAAYTVLNANMKALGAQLKARAKDSGSGDGGQTSGKPQTRAVRPRQGWVINPGGPWSIR